MSITFLRPLQLDQLPKERPLTDDWLWDGYLAPGNITLLTSLWKTGKTTLLAGLLRALGQNEPFLGLGIRPGHALVVSEESQHHWAARVQRMPVGSNVHLLARPFVGRPDEDDWQALLDEAMRMRQLGQLDLFVIDPMAMFLPGPWESSATILLKVMEPLHALTQAGVSVLLLHHPRKQKSEAGHSARGTGALLGFVDISLELSRYGRLTSDSRRRQIVALSRHPNTPERLIYEWDPETGQFAVSDDPVSIQFQQNWHQLQMILSQRTQAATHKELLMDWTDEPKPAASVLY